MSTIPVLPLWQPWASLVAIGAKTIETRSKPTKVRGRIAIHACVTRKGFPIEPRNNGEFVIGDYVVELWRQVGARMRRDGVITPMPFGAIVATANLVDCVPINPDDEFRGRDAVFRYTEGHALRSIRGAVPIDVTDQLPYGDFTSGRWAWILEDITPVNPPIPHKGSQGWGRIDTKALPSLAAERADP